MSWDRKMPPDSWILNGEACQSHAYIRVRGNHCGQTRDDKRSALRSPPPPLPPRLFSSLHLHLIPPPLFTLWLTSLPPPFSTFYVSKLSAMLRQGILPCPVSLNWLSSCPSRHLCLYRCPDDSPVDLRSFSWVWLDAGTDVGYKSNQKLGGPRGIHHRHSQCPHQGPSALLLIDIDADWPVLRFAASGYRATQIKYNQSSLVKRDR